jgi:hypothetical protein
MLIYQNNNNEEEFMIVGGVKVPKAIKYSDRSVYEGNVYGSIVFYKLRDGMMLTFDSEKFEITFSIDSEKHKYEFVFFVKKNVRQVTTSNLHDIMYIITKHALPNSDIDFLDPRSKFVSNLSEPCVVVFENTYQIESIHFVNFKCFVKYDAHGNCGVITGGRFGDMPEYHTFRGVDGVDLNSILPLIISHDFTKLTEVLGYSCEAGFPDGRKVIISNKSFTYNNRIFDVYIVPRNYGYIVILEDIQSKFFYQIKIGIHKEKIIALMYGIGDEDHPIVLEIISSHITSEDLIEWIKLCDDKRQTNI